MTAPDPGRRTLLALLAASAAYAGLSPLVAHANGRDAASARAEAALDALERRHGGRLGVWVLEAGADTPGFGHRADERFGLCSTFKLLLAAVVLREADAGRLDLETPLPFGADDLVPHSPVTAAHVERGALPIGELAYATQTTSDNLAANLLLRHFGGPDGFTARLRELGDGVTRIDRMEPEMNLVPPGELRDTTTPRAIATTVARLFTGDLLTDAARSTLMQWMIDTRTGLKRLRAGLPGDWLVGDKTGTGIARSMPNRHNDVAVAWRPGRPPLVIAAYYEADGHYPAMRAADDAVLADVGRIVAEAVG